MNGTFAETFDGLITFVQAPVVPLNSTWDRSTTHPESQSREEGFVIKRANAAIAEKDGMTEQALLDLIPTT